MFKMFMLTPHLQNVLQEFTIYLLRKSKCRVRAEGNPPFLWDPEMREHFLLQVIFIQGMTVICQVKCNSHIQTHFHI